MTAEAMPILGRELLVAARRSSTYWGRFQAALLALVATALVLVDQTVALSSSAVIGARLFRTLSFLAVIYVMLAAVRLTSDCLSSEKREATLGFLFLTHLKPFDVVIGKLAATSLSGLYALAAILPALVIPVLCGGVTLGDIFRLAVVLLNSLFLAVTVALLVSACSWQARTAGSMTFLFLLTISVVVPVVAAFAGNVVGGPMSLGLGLVSPLAACWLVVNNGLGGTTQAFWFSVGITHIVAWLSLAACCQCLPRIWMDRPAARKQLRWREGWRRLLMGGVAARVAFRIRALNRNPIFWLGSRELRARWYPWIFLGSMTVLTAVLCGLLRVREIELEWLLPISFGLHLFFKQWVTHLASAAFATERAQGALELLLSTPLSVPDMLRGHRLVLWRQFAYPLAFLIGVELVAWVISLSGRNPDRWLFSAFFLSGLIVFLADLWALSWLGWWKGAVSKTAGQAASATVLRVLAFPWLPLVVSVVAANVFWQPSERQFLRLVPILYVLISLINDACFGLRARHRLLTELRLVAVERADGNEAASGSWSKLRRFMLGR